MQRLLNVLCMEFGLLAISCHGAIRDMFGEQALWIQNYYRHKHNAGSLHLDKKLSENATKWATTLAKDDQIRPSSIKKASRIKENLCMACGFTFNGYDVALEWYRQACNYDFSNYEKIPGHEGGIENFETMVWKSAKHFGIGRARSKNLDCTYIVAWYKPIKGKPKGNVDQGAFIGLECPPPGKNPQTPQYLNDGKRRIFLCGGSAKVLRKKACEHFGCKNGLLVGRKNKKKSHRV